MMLFLCYSVALTYLRVVCIFAVWHKKSPKYLCKIFRTLALLRRLDSNERPPGYEPGELPTAPLRDVNMLSALDWCPYAVAYLEKRLTSNKY